ncbi:MAG TPA: aconitase/3-isopropylmalate dehydratase large subunit family protein [Gemmatimonadaceae bacterium]|nr:aconitase/3-isopropylmalate dehydratase large subunit family protein [Gemmatimonadaceae bacterium]
MTRPKTISEKILSAKSGIDAVAGDIVDCTVDLVLGTDASAPMAIDYFRRMDGARLFDASRVLFSLDHYSPPNTPATLGFHAEVRGFGREHGAEVLDVGDGISHQVAAERGLVRPGDLIIGADSHTVTSGALGAFAIGVGSSELAAAMITGRVWLRVPETIAVVLRGSRAPGVAAKDAALALIAELGADGANYQTLEFRGPGVNDFSIDDRFVFSNLAVEGGAKAAIWPVDDETRSYLAQRRGADCDGVTTDAGAAIAREIILDLAALTPRVAVPHSPNDVVDIDMVAGTPIQMVFIGTCAGGRVSDIHEVLAMLERAGSRIAAGVKLVVTPASREVHDRLAADGTLARLVELGAIVTTAGCGACCGTSGVIPDDGMNVLSTANRNFKARMGNATASIYLASPAACALAAVTGAITDPREAAG